MLFPAVKPATCSIAFRIPRVHGYCFATAVASHANSRITLDLYAQAGMPNKRLAQSKLVRMVLNKGEALAQLDQIGP